MYIPVPRMKDMVKLGDSLVEVTEEQELELCRCCIGRQLHVKNKA
jgi:hypothetical protein